VTDREKHEKQVALAKDGKKYCSRCKEIKDISDFGNWKSGWDGLMKVCRRCRSELRRQWYNNPLTHEKHKEYVRNYMRSYYKRHKAGRNT
jgi:hypothetical protein